LTKRSRWGIPSVTDKGGSMHYAVFEWSISCPKCDSPVMLNGPLQTAHCDRCQADIPIPHEYWKDMLADILKEVKTEFDEGDGTNSNVFGTFKTTMLYGKLHPRCEKCKTRIEQDQPVTKQVRYECIECGAVIPIDPVPSWLQELLPSIKVLFNTELESGTRSEEPEFSGPIVFSCPKCGGALEVDGTERLLPCPYCKVTVYLPDDLWFRLHPIKQKERWFIGFE
jgi:hypothetical protein